MSISALRSARCIFSVMAVTVFSALLLVGCGKDDDDGDGKGNNIRNYRTVKIGNQTWMAENLDYDVEGSKCYDNDPANCAKYGRLYTWDAARKACPAGWHLPTFVEWTTLMDYVGSTTAGKNLKSTSGWDESGGKNGNGTDDHGFTALPGGNAYYEVDDESVKDCSNGCFSDAGEYAYWWSDTEYDTDNAYDLAINNSVEHVLDYISEIRNLKSARCVQD